MNKETLVKKLKALHVPPKTSLPSLSHVLIENNTCETTFSTTDLDITTVVKVIDLTSNDFTAVVDYASLVKAIDATPKGSEISLTVANKKLNIHTPIGIFNLPSDSRESYPSLPEIADNTRTDHTTAIVDKLVSLMPFVADRNEIRASLTGICYNKERSELVGTNGHVMGIFKNAPEMFHQSTIIDGNGIKPLLQLVKASESYDRKEYAPMAIGSLLTKVTNLTTGEITTGDITYTQFSGEDWMISIRKVEGPYPPYEKVIPANNQEVINLDRKVIDNIPIKLINPATHQILLACNNDKITAYGENTDSMSWESECGTGSYNGQIAFNACLLQDIANFVDNNPLVLKVKDCSTAVLYEDTERIALLMPVRLPEPE